MSGQDVVSWKNFGDVTFSAGVAAFGQYAHWNDQKMNEFQKTLLGIDATLAKYLAGDKK